MKITFKKGLLAAIAALTVCSARADEGMWLLQLMKQQNSIDMMKKQGLKLEADDLYNPNGVSLKDAVGIFGGGCTGEIISPEGLILTNHHCGYGAIQQHSSVEHDYLTDGFWAMNRSEELPTPGLKFRFVHRIVDITDLVNAKIKAGEVTEIDALTSPFLNKLAKEELEKSDLKGKPGIEVRALPFYAGNKFYMFYYKVYSDVRMVAAPPSSVGKFGGETDNWMWPRHTGDFSIFRVYAGADNRPAEYAPENRPYRAEKFLKISLDGVDEGDFAMVMGFPGSTERYMTSYEIDNLLGTENPQRIFIRGERQAILWDDMMADDAVRIQYASKYAMSSNYWKNSIGMSRGIRKLGVKARKEAQEASFQAWAEKNTLPEEGYIDALAKIREAELRGGPIYAGVQYLSEAFLGAVELLNPVRAFINMDKMAVEETIADPDAVKERLAEWYKDYNPATDRKVAKRMLTIARENMKTLPSFYADVVDEQFGVHTEHLVQ